MAKQSPRPGETPAAKRTWRRTNWPDHNRALAAPGGVTLWLHDEVLRNWRAVGGKGMRYSDPVRPAHSGGLQAVFAADRAMVSPLALVTMARGGLSSLKTMLRLTVPAPHYATLSRRATDLAVPKLKRGAMKGPLHLAIDLGRAEAVRRGRRTMAMTA